MRALTIQTTSAVAIPAEHLIPRRVALSSQIEVLLDAAPMTLLPSLFGSIVCDVIERQKRKLVHIAARAVRRVGAVGDQRLASHLVSVTLLDRLVLLGVVFAPFAHVSWIGLSHLTLTPPMRHKIKPLKLRKIRVFEVVR